MKKINTSHNTDLLVGLLFGGIIAALLAYRIFAWLCEVTAFLWWMVPLGLAALVLAVGGVLVAYRAWRRLQYLRDHPGE
jgi:uncharacterized membrane protein YcaP (DUF421 family)